MRRNRSHPGQIRGSARKREARTNRRDALKTEASGRGVDIMAIVRERQLKVEQILANAAAEGLAAEHRARAKQAQEQRQSAQIRGWRS